MEVSNKSSDISLLDSEKDFLSNVDYLKSLVKVLQSKSPSDYDSNLVYEAVYADMYVTDVITKVSSPNLVLTLNDVRLALEIILKDIPDEKVLEARASQDYTKILKNKYKNIDDGAYVEKKAYKRNDNIISAYFHNRLPALIVGGMMMIFVMFGIPSKIVHLVCPQSSVTTEVDSSIESDEQTEVVDNQDSLPNTLLDSEMSLSNANTEELIGAIGRILSVVITMFCTMIAAFSAISTAVDLMYLSFPMIREMFDSRTDGTYFASVEARGLVESFNDTVLSYKEIKSFDRINRNLYWLDSMLENLQTVDISNNSRLRSLKSSLTDVKELLDTKDSLSTKRYYMNIAKIEFLHDMYLNLIDGVA